MGKGIIRVILAVGAIMVCMRACALTLAGNVTPSPAVAINSPSPEHPGYDCIAAAPLARVLSTGPNSSFIAAWNAVLPREWDPSTWTLDWSTSPLDTTLNLTTYQAYNLKPGDPGYGQFYAGSEIRIEWNPAADQQDLQWIQAIYSNRSRYPTTQYYLDISTLRPPQDQPPAYPYSFADHHFYDKPSRPCEPDRHIFWTAYLYLARIDRSAKSVTVHEGLSWGYTIDCLVPEPGILASLLAGSGCVGAALLRGRTRQKWDRVRHTNARPVELVITHKPRAPTADTDLCTRGS